MKKAGRKATRPMERVAFGWLGKPSEEAARHPETYFALKWKRKEPLGKGMQLRISPNEIFVRSFHRMAEGKGKHRGRKDPAAG